MKLTNEIDVLKEFSALERAVSKLMPAHASDSCHGGYELVGGRCIAVCPSGPSDALGLTSDCIMPQTNDSSSYFIFIFSIVVWFYVIYRMSLSRHIK